jgi:hypothetical protein
MMPQWKINENHPFIDEFHHVWMIFPAIKPLFSLGIFQLAMFDYQVCIFSSVCWDWFQGKTCLQAFSLGEL